MKKLIYSSALSASVSIITLTAVTIGAELAPGFKTVLAGITGHHWITKSWLVVVLFPIGWLLVRGFSRGEVTDGAVRRSLWVLIVSVVVGFLAILGFFIGHYF